MRKRVSTAGRTPQKWALLIGIDRYPKMPPDVHLRGCLHDVAAVEALLTSGQFGFPAQNIVKLTSPAADPKHLATRANILDTFRRHLIENGGVGPEDVVVVYYSGHGSQIPDEDGDEETGYDQTIVPCDAGPDRSCREDVIDISDDEIYLLLEALAGRTQNINLFVDSCHSGSITRGLQDAEARDAGGRERYLPPATYKVEPRARTRDTRDTGDTRTTRGTRSLGPSGWMPVGDGYVVISACRSLERAREDGFFELPWFKHYGILTYYLLKAVRNAGPETTYLDIWEELKLNVTRRNRWQNPQIEGAFERKVFGGAMLPRRRYFEVTGVEKNEVRLAAGAVHNATVGSRYAVYGKQARALEGERGRVAVVRLKSVGDFGSAGEVEKGDAARVQVGGCAVEIEHDFGPMRMAVHVAGNEPVMEDVRARVSASPLLTDTAAREGAGAAVTLRYPYLQNGEEDTGAGRKLFILGGDGHPLVEPIEPGEGGAVTALEKLEHIAKYQNLLAIDNPDQRSRLRGKVKLRLLKAAAGAGNEPLPPERNQGGELVLKDCDRIVLEVENKADMPVYITLFDFSPQWRVSPFFPPPAATDNSVAAGSSRRTKRQKVSLPSHLKSLPAGLPLPLEIVKLIATTEPVNFRSIYLPPTRGGEKDAAAESSLFRVLEAAWGVGVGRATRSLERGADELVSDWAVDTVSFRISP
jgi:hypothetical protein